MTTSSDRGTVLLDLDGTISDPRAGMFSAFRHALASVGRPWPDDKPLDWMIGPPLLQTFGEVLGGQAAAWQALQHYREYYSAGALYDNTLYPGMSDAIDAIDRRRLPPVRRDLETRELRPAHPAEFRSRRSLRRRLRLRSSTARSTRKRDIIARCLKAEGVDTAACVMVGDRKHDVLGAAANGLPCIGVTWGYGGTDELQTAGAASICAEPVALPAAVARALAR